MRRFPALLLAAGLAAAPARAVAAPSLAHPSTRSQTVEMFSWSTSRGRLGVMVLGLTPELRAHFGAPKDRGVLVAQVEPGTPAATAGLAVGDVIVGVRGQKVDEAPDVLAAVSCLGKGHRATIELVRDGRSRTLEATMTSDAATGAASSSVWLDDPMRSFLEHHATPFMEQLGFGASTKRPDPAGAPSWLHKLLARLGAKDAAPRCSPP